jgi:hypothetical protein
MLPEDNMRMLSVFNTKLRDFYASLDEMCEDMNVDREEIIKRLESIDYKYDEKLNRFI